MTTEHIRLGVGIVGSGFIANFHVQSWRGVRDADIVAIQSRNLETASGLADFANRIGVGRPSVTTELIDLVRDPAVDAIWVTSPNHVRVECIETICDEVASGRAQLRGIAMEKPLARTVAEARRIEAAISEAGLLCGYLENQVFAPALTRGHEITWSRGSAVAGPPYLARTAEEHSGPHRAWFWDGRTQGGGVLNDMMCHSIEAARFLLTPPGHTSGQWLTPTAVSATMASLKWSRPAYADRLRSTYGPSVDYTHHPAEDFARATITFRTADGHEAIAEATTSWSYVGPGLRLSFELLGPEYSMQVNTLDVPTKVFLSRELTQAQGEDLLEKQNAEQGLMPVIEDEPLTYGYTEENRHMVRSFLNGVQPREGLAEGMAVVELVMASYLAAETGDTIYLPEHSLETFVPAVAQGTWKAGASISV